MRHAAVMAGQWRRALPMRHAAITPRSHDRALGRPPLRARLVRRARRADAEQPTEAVVPALDVIALHHVAPLGDRAADVHRAERRDDAERGEARERRRLVAEPELGRGRDNTNARTYAHGFFLKLHLLRRPTHAHFFLTLHFSTPTARAVERVAVHGRASQHSNSPKRLAWGLLRFTLVIGSGMLCFGLVSACGSYLSCAVGGGVARDAPGRRSSCGSCHRSSAARGTTRRSPPRRS